MHEPREWVEAEAEEPDPKVTETGELVTRDRLARSYGILGMANASAKLISRAAVWLIWTAASPIQPFVLAAAPMAVSTGALIGVR